MPGGTFALVEFDDVTQTGDLPAGPDVIYKREPLPWVLLIIVAILAGVAVALLWSKASSEGDRADEAAASLSGAEARAKEAEGKLSAAEKRALDAETNLKVMTSERDGLQEKLDKLAAKPAAAEAPSEPVAKKPPPAKKKTTKKKKRR